MRRPGSLEAGGGRVAVQTLMRLGGAGGQKESSDVAARGCRRRLPSELQVTTLTQRHFFHRETVPLRLPGEIDSARMPQTAT
jgi:hypothetical protein